MSDQVSMVSLRDSSPVSRSFRWTDGIRTAFVHAWSRFPSTIRWRKARRVQESHVTCSGVQSASQTGKASVTVNGSGRIMSSNSYESFQQEVINEEQVRAYLRENGDFLEDYLMEQVEMEQLERWMIRRMQRDKRSMDADGKIARKTSLSRWKFCVHADKRKMLQELTQSLHVRPNQENVLWELASCISSAVSADSFRLYLAFRNPNGVDQLRRYEGNADESDQLSSISNDIAIGSTLSSFVAKTRDAIRAAIPAKDPRFPQGIGQDQDSVGNGYVMCQPIVSAAGELVGILELYRRSDGTSSTPSTPFYEEDEEIANSYLVWGGIAMHYAELYLSMNKQRRLNEFLLTVVKSIFQDMVSMDILIMKIMNFAQRLVDADRASLFLVDHKSQELFARIFDMSGKDMDETTLQQMPTQTDEIRFPIGTGIAGQVAQTGEILNITDAYSDNRFHRGVDQLTGYVTQTILCMPIFIRGAVIGVVQMVNKRTGVFTKDDEESFETFAVYCGLALHHAKLYDKIRRSEQKYRVALDVLSYHNSCNDDELIQLKQMDIPDKQETVLSFTMNPSVLTDMDKVRYTVFMFVDLFGLSRFDVDNLMRFSLTVRKNYRRVPYHNWSHGFAVANSMYTILKHAPKGMFSEIESIALYVGSLCHDLDHRGKNNKYMLDTESPLAAIYSTSTMEHHHFNQTVTILQQGGHNIFNKLTSEEYKNVLGCIKHCILATDLALFFPNKAKLGKLVEEEYFKWDNTEHRLLLEAIAMTGADLCASTKPWEVQTQTVRVIFEEFYEQGDAERNAGREPIAMMDRNKREEQGNMQVGFLTGICIPCYELLYKLLPQTKPMLDGCKKNLSQWKSIAAQQKKDKEEREQAEKEQDTTEEPEPAVVVNNNDAIGDDEDDFVVREKTSES